MSKSKHSAKFAINFLADLCCWLFALISIIYSGQCISRQLYLRQFIDQQFEGTAVFCIVDHQYFSVLSIPRFLPIVSPHETL